MGDFALVLMGWLGCLGVFNGLPGQGVLDGMPFAAQQGRLVGLLGLGVVLPSMGHHIVGSEVGAGVAASVGLEGRPAVVGGEGRIGEIPGVLPELFDLLLPAFD